MTHLSRMTVGAKLGLGFTTALLLLAVSGGLSINDLADMNGEVHKFSEARLPSVEAASTVAQAITDYRLAEYRFLADPADQRDAAAQRLDAKRHRVVSDLDTTRRQAASVAERELATTLTSQWKDYAEASRQVETAVRAGSTEATALFDGIGSQRFDALVKTARDIVATDDRDAAAAGQRADAMFSRTRATLVSVIVLAVLLAGGLGWLIARAITRPLMAALRVVQAVAAGDLTQTVQADGRDEIAQLVHGLGSMVARLRQLVAEIHVGVDSVNTASGQIAAGTLDLSARTERTASHVQETAASMEEISGGVTSSADAARRADELARGAMQAAQRGGQTMQEVVGSMEGISESSHHIGEIVSVIDGIAFQINILSLNAAVEAARAGEAGRGFAVVASEVRSLARRSADAAREIKGLIGASTERVDTGAVLVGQARERMGEIVASVQQLAQMMAEIRNSSAEQQKGVAQINEAISGLDEMTQQNAALVEESAAASGSLREQAANLFSLISAFKVDPDAGSGLHLRAA